MKHHRMSLRAGAALAAATLVAQLLPGQIVRLVKDLDPRAPERSRGFEPEEVTRVGNKTFFLLDTPAYGRELWVSDGTKAGTMLVRDLRVGPRDSNPRELTALGSQLVFFSADDGVHGRELWVSDGTAAGTKLVGDIQPGARSGNPTNLTATSRRLFFTASDPAAGNELFSTTGNAANLIDVVPGSASSTPRDLSVVADRLYLSIADPVTGREPYRVVDRFPRRLADLNVGRGSSNPGRFVQDPQSAGGVLFVADIPGRGAELVVFRQDKALKLRELRDGPFGSNPRDLLTVGNKTFFTADDGVRGRELHVFDGTPPRRVLEIRPGRSSAGIADMVTLGKQVFFAADDGTNGIELWTSDGTAVGTKLLVDLVAGGGSGRPRNMIVMGGKIYFTAFAGRQPGNELFECDGTAAGTKLFHDFGSVDSNPRALHAFSSTVLGCIANLPNFGAQYLRLDLSSKTQVHPRILNPILRAGDPKHIFAMPGTSTVLFQATTPATGRELFRSDGTPNGTVLVKDIAPGTASSTPTDFVAASERVYFLSKQRLFETDGTEAGTQRIDGTSARLSALHACFGKVFMRANDFRSVKPFVFDPDTRRFTDLSSAIPNEAITAPEDFTTTRIGCFFTANFARRGRQLFVTDGSLAGTRMVSDFPVGQMRDLARLSDELVLLVVRQNGSEILFVSDGTTKGTKPVLAGGNPVENPRNIVAVENSKEARAFFVATAGRGRNVVFRTNGRTAAIVGSLINGQD